MLIFWGGPVEVKEIFVLHSSEYQSETTKNYGSISISQDYKILFDIAGKKGPEKSLVILGYSGWDEQQLDNELQSNAWLVSENIHNNEIIAKSCSTFWREKMLELGGDYSIWSNAPENPSYN